MIFHEINISGLPVFLVDKLDDYCNELGKLYFTLDNRIKCTGVLCENCPLPECDGSIQDLLNTLNITPETYPELFL